MLKFIRFFINNWHHLCISIVVQGLLERLPSDKLSLHLLDTRDSLHNNRFLHFLQNIPKSLIGEVTELLMMLVNYFVKSLNLSSIVFTMVAELLMNGRLEAFKLN